MDLRIFFENFHQKRKNVSCGAQFFEDIDLRESHAKLHKKPSETLEADWI